MSDAEFERGYTKGVCDGFRIGYQIAMKDQAAAPPAADAVTELPEPGEGMPSDEELLLYATPFFETEAAKKIQAAVDDANEDEK